MMKLEERSEGHSGLYNGCRTRKSSIEQGNRIHDRDDDNSFQLIHQSLSDANR